MNTYLPPAAKAALQFEEKILPNGLAIRVHTMPGYGAAHVIYATRFGSIDSAFMQNGKKISLPAGLAHFLEHKMFENEDGVDAFTLFGETGAVANAYTGFDRTSYIFTAANMLAKNLDILLSFVGRPFFTEQTVAKEQGIIGQEISMYNDHPEIRSLFALFECLYHEHPIRQDIVGTAESIAQITPQVLYSCTNVFYTPSNMAICAAGNITMDDVLQAVERANLSSQRGVSIERCFPKEPPQIAQKEKHLNMSVAMPLFAVGFKESPVFQSTLKTEVVSGLLCELLFGDTSTLYRRLYDDGLVQPGFGAEFGCYEQCLQFIVSGESHSPHLVREAVLEEIALRRKQGIDEQQFETCKKMLYGDAISDLENVNRVASTLSSSYFRGRTPAQEVDMIAAVTLQDVEQGLHDMLQEPRSAYVTVSAENNSKG